MSKSILPFAIFQTDFVVLPITISVTYGIKKINVKPAIDLLRDGYIDAAKWFQKAENFWTIYRTENNKTVTLEKYLDWQNKLTTQDLDSPFMVIYSASAKDANAAVLCRKDFDLEFIVESKGYVYYSSNIDECHYLTAILNSNITNLLMKDFQSKGLFGARDVHKKILDIFYPLFNANKKEHKKLAELSKSAHEKTKVYLEKNDIKQVQGSNHLGRIRLNIKKELEQELHEIDLLVKIIIG